MDEEPMQDLAPQAGEQLERQLARYARVRLDPTPAATRRARNVVMTAAWRRRLLPDPEAVAPLAAGPRSRGRRGPFAGWSARRLGASLAAASLAGLLLGTSAFAASRAGGPLYETRIAIETAMLPADAGARLEGELALAQTRLAEVADAAARGDQGALTAALEAYGRSIGDLESSTGGPAQRALEAVEFHQSVLRALEATLPPQAIAGIERALERSNAVIEHLQATGGPGAGGEGGAGGNGGNGNAGGGGGNGPGGPPTDKPGRTPDADKTPGPDRTPKPAATPKPATTPAPHAGGDGSTSTDHPGPRPGAS